MHMALVLHDAGLDAPTWLLLPSRALTMTFGPQDLNLDLAPLAAQLKKPLRPLWITRDTPLPAKGVPRFEDFHAVVLCTASGRVEGAEVAGGGYIQGAADDSEGWARVCTLFHIPLQVAFYSPHWSMSVHVPDWRSSQLPARNLKKASSTDTHR